MPRALAQHAGRALALLLALLAGGTMAAQPGLDAARLERSFWLHASLGPTTQKGYYGTDFPAAVPPTREEIGNAARLLAGSYGANRLYLVYHRVASAGDR